MPETARLLKIVVASPRDCSAERETVRRVVAQDPAIKTLCRNLGVAIDVFGWEDVFPEIGRPQSLINAEIEKFRPDWFVFICWHRIGTDAGLGQTGLEEEWELARGLSQRGEGYPKVSIYFNLANPLVYEVDRSQQEAVERFRDSIFSRHEAMAADFNCPLQFEDLIRAHLTQRLLECSEDTPGSKIQEIKQQLLTASTGLINWPKALGNGETIERPELASLLSRSIEKDHTVPSTTFILGGPGTGKSALLSNLAQNLVSPVLPSGLWRTAIFISLRISRHLVDRTNMPPHFFVSEQ